MNLQDITARLRRMVFDRESALFAFALTAFCLRHFNPGFVWAAVIFAVAMFGWNMAIRTASRHSKLHLLAVGLWALLGMTAGSFFGNGLASILPALIGGALCGGLRFMTGKTVPEPDK